jgi:rod shape-determining protein MreC
MKRFFLRHKILANISLILLVQILLISFQVKDSSDRPLIAGPVALVLTPAQSAADISLKWIADKWNKYVWLRNKEDENRILQDKICKLEEEIILQGRMETRLRTLEGLLRFKAETAYATEPAIITGLGSSVQYKSVFINKGESAGLKKYQPVINNQGLVGMIVLTTPFTSQIQLLTDSNTAVSVVTEKSAIRGILTGWSDDFLVINYIDKHEKIIIGEKVITNGLDEIFPYGLLVGTISETADGSDIFLRVVVKPAVDFKHVDSVLILKNKVMPVTEETAIPENTQ